jgi:spermidine synthase
MIDNYKKRFGLSEMMVHVPMCSHNNIKKVLVVGKSTKNLENDLAKHACKDITYLEELNIDEKFDIIIYDKDTPTNIQMAQIHRLLKDDDSIFVCKGTFIYKDLEKSKEELTTIGEKFWICMPYSFGHNTLIFASKKYHPQAEIILQVSDLLPDCEYYNTELHNASFVHPQYITKAITGIAKR